MMFIVAVSGMPGPHSDLDRALEGWPRPPSELKWYKFLPSGLPQRVEFKFRPCESEGSILNLIPLLN